MSLTKFIESIGCIPEFEETEEKQDLKENQKVTFILGNTNERANVKRRDG